MHTYCLCPNTCQRGGGKTERERESLFLALRRKASKSNALLKWKSHLSLKDSAKTSNALKKLYIKQAMGVY